MFSNFSGRSPEGLLGHCINYFLKRVLNEELRWQENNEYSETKEKRGGKEITTTVTVTGKPSK